MKTTKCTQCPTTFDYEPAVINGREYFTPNICPKCEKNAEAEEKASKEEADRQRKITQWETICPDLYRGTDIFRLPPYYRTAIEKWKYGSMGLAFVGTHGKGKTRAAFQILHKEHFAGRRCMAINATDLSAKALEKFDDNPKVKTKARDDLYNCRRADILLLDDLGKGKLTDRAEEELYDLLEKRTTRRVPTIWTANAGGDDLLGKLSADRGPAILRRLTDFSDII
jgi:DNA replication protein DnaC